MLRDQQVLDDAAEHRRGALLVGGAALAWSSAGLLTRWTHTDPWTTLFWRSVFAGAALLLHLLVTERRRAAIAFARLGPIGLALGLCFAASMTSFINALNLTTVANVMVFQAASPLFAAVLAWFWLRERITGRVAAAIGATVLGVLVMVSSRAGLGDPARALRGDLLALVMSLTSALVIILARLDRGVSMSAAICAGMALTAALALPFADLAPSLRDLGLLALFGLGQMALALVLFTSGVRLIPAAEVGLISIVECVLAAAGSVAFGKQTRGAAPGPR